MDEWGHGDVSITEVVEADLWSGPATASYPHADMALWDENADWLVPEHWAPDADETHSIIRTWVVRSSGLTILVDTGVGNDHLRPHSPRYTQWSTGFLDHLAAAGVAPDDVDLVVNTHLHFDHVGWNTRLGANGEWQPTFPRAQYLVAAAELDFWNPANTVTQRGAPMNAGVWEDSIAPLVDAGAITPFEDGHHIDAHLRLRVLPGHTPGHSIVEATSDGEQILLVGDMLHTPMQVAEPHVCLAPADEDQAIAVAARQRLLHEAADRGSLILPGHFAGTGGFRVAHRGASFTIESWAG